MRTVAIVMVSVMVAALSTASGAGKRCEVDQARIVAGEEMCTRFGVSTPGGPGAGDEYAAVMTAAGAPPALEQWFVDFTAPPPIADLATVSGRGAQPVVTWEPWRSLGDGGYDRAAFPMQEIAAGVHDDYLYRWADELIAWGGTVYLRFAHEPNGDWYPWSPAGGTPPEVYVAAWRHVHDLFAVKNAHNVRWIWAVNVTDDPGDELGPLYPGDAYVDVVGVDGYNWGTTQQWSRWQRPDELFGPTLAAVTRLAPGKPVVLTEVASAEEGGSKATWIRDLVSYVDLRRDVSAFIWFDHHKETDWRLTSSPGVVDAVQKALGREY